MNPLIPLGFCLLPEKPRHIGRSVIYPHYMHEILSHAGLFYETISLENLEEKLPSLQILITVGETEFSGNFKTALTSWVDGGGAWISIGGVCGMSDLLGVEVLPVSYQGWSLGVSSVGEGYLQKIHKTHPVLKHVTLPLHFFGGIAAKNTHGNLLAEILDVHQRKTRRAAVVESDKGKGHCLFIAPDVTGTVVRIQQGIAVTRDGIPAPDGTAPLNETVLKCNDGIVLDWIFDRRGIKGIDGYKAFLDPISDLWREIVLRSIFHLAQIQEIALPLLWLYPRNKPAMAHMSNDTDQNDPERARRLLHVLDNAGIHSTWCIILPGYEKSLIGNIRENGHELAMHFDALEDNKRSWSESEFQKQFQDLTRLFDGRKPLTNKNHYTRWEGDTEFYDWCERYGIKFDESKGPAKTGDVGFLFGTCHPYLPLDPRGRTIDVLELPFLTQDLVLTAPRELGDASLLSVLKCHGIAHFLFHPHHIIRKDIEDALIYIVEKAKSLDMEWWPAWKINAWERARRNASWSHYRKTEKSSGVTFRSAESLDQATMLWLLPSEAKGTLNGRTLKSDTVIRWGFPFQAMTFDAPAGVPCVFEMDLRI
jgi:hypothetical protein